MAGRTCSFCIGISVLGNSGGSSDDSCRGACGYLSKNFLWGRIEDYGMGRIVVGFGPGRSEDVLFRNIVFLDRVPMIEVDLIKKDKKLLVRKRLVNHEG